MSNQPRFQILRHRPDDADGMVIEPLYPDGRFFTSEADAKAHVRQLARSGDYGPGVLRVWVVDF